MSVVGTPFLTPFLVTGGLTQSFERTAPDCTTIQPERLQPSNLLLPFRFRPNLEPRHEHLHIAPIQPILAQIEKPQILPRAIVFEVAGQHLPACELDLLVVPQQERVELGRVEQSAEERLESLFGELS